VDSEGIIVSDPSDILELVPVRRGNRVELAVRFRGEVVHLDTINLASAKQRQRFVSDVIAKVPALQERCAELEQELLNLSAQPTDEARPDQAAGDLRELDISRIVRPEQFFTSEVSGLAVPVGVSEGGKPIGKWMLHLRWADGRRERRELPPCIDLPGGGRLWLHPIPGAPSITAAPAWSAAARRAWLQGADAPDPGELFRRLCERFLHYLEFPPEAAKGATATLALWSLFTYCYQAWPAVPYLYIGGPVGSGKSRTFDVLERVGYRPFKTDNITAAGLFRTLHDQGGTLLVDEAERLRQSTPDQQDLLGILLAGYRRGGQASRLDKVGDGFQMVRYDVFGPKALACITGLPSTLASRAIPVAMFRAGADSPKPRRRLDEDPDSWLRLRDDLHSLALEHGPAWLDLSRRAEVCPAELRGRHYELWQPLLALSWWLEGQGVKGLHQLVSDHARQLMESSKDDLIPEADEALLVVLTEFVRDGRWPTPGEILEKVLEQEGATFKTWGPRAVSNRLKAYGLKTKSRRGRREYREVTLHQLERIQHHYGIDLGFEPAAEKNGGPAPQTSSPCAPCAPFEPPNPDGGSAR
jgi:hypothetical protein